LKKGIDAIAGVGRQQFFSKEDAMVDLGVGKNMVQSIRHWCLAARLIRPADNKTDGYVTTPLGSSIFLAPGHDPFLEDPATLWLLHWQIASNKQNCTTWYWLFNLWHSVEFTKSEVHDELNRWLERNEYKSATTNTLVRDIDTCVRTYVQPRRSKAKVSEDSFSSPLTELNLITEIDDGKTFQITRGEQRSLPNEIFLYGLTQFWERAQGNLSSISLEKITYDPGSPGKIFKLDGESIARRLDEISATSNNIFSFEEKSGLKQLYRREQVAAEYWLDVYYEKTAD
jgi:hypothetical protein